MMVMILTDGPSYDVFEGWRLCTVYSYGFMTMINDVECKIDEVNRFKTIHFRVIL
jgi:hypothetical protein